MSVLPSVRAAPCVRKKQSMTGKPTIQVEGLNKVVRQLGKLGPDVKDELKSSNREMAEKLVGPVKSKAPVRTGDMRNSVRAGATQRSGVVRAGKKKVPYVGPIHFGWPARRIAPNPFMWEVLDSRRGQIEREYLDRITDIAEKVR